MFMRMHMNTRHWPEDTIPYKNLIFVSSGYSQDRLYRRINSPPTQSLWSMNQSNVVSRSNPVSDAWDANSPVVGVQHSNPLNRSLNIGCHLHSPLVTPKTPMQTASGIRPLAGVMSPNTCGALGTENLISMLNTPKR